MRKHKASLVRKNIVKEVVLAGSAKDGQSTPVIRG